jgi:hypothetical protein
VTDSKVKEAINKFLDKDGPVSKVRDSLKLVSSLLSSSSAIWRWAEHFAATYSCWIDCAKDINYYLDQYGNKDKMEDCYDEQHRTNAFNSIFRIAEGAAQIRARANGYFEEANEQFLNIQDSENDYVLYGNSRTKFVKVIVDNFVEAQKLIPQADEDLQKFITRMTSCAMCPNTEGHPNK